MKKAKGYYRRRVKLWGGEWKETKSRRSFLPFSQTTKTQHSMDLLDLDVEHEIEDRLKAIAIFGSVDSFNKWKKEKETVINQEFQEKQQRRKEGAYDIPTYKKYDPPSPTYTIGEDGIARQRKYKL